MSRQIHLNFNLSCCQITLGIKGKITLHCIFLLVCQTLDENICLPWLKFYLSRASGQVIFYPWMPIYRYWFINLMLLRKGLWKWLNLVVFYRQTWDQQTLNKNHMCWWYMCVITLTEPVALTLHIYGLWCINIGHYFFSSQMYYPCVGLVVSVPASHAVHSGLAPQPGHTKDHHNKSCPARQQSSPVCVCVSLCVHVYIS